MKTSALLFLILFGMANITLAQIPGNKIKGPVTILNHQFVEGDTLRIATGSDPNGDFKFIYQPQNDLLGVPQNNLSKMYANTRAVIKHFKQFESRKIGKKLFTVINVGGLNSVVEIEAAINSGEISVAGIAAISKSAAGSFQSNSLADEISKLKKLFDDGVLTEEEYNKAKAKLLGL